MAFGDFFLAVANGDDFGPMHVHCEACGVTVRPSHWRSHVRGTYHSFKLERQMRLHVAGLLELTDVQERLQDSYSARKRRRLGRCLGMACLHG